MNLTELISELNYKDVRKLEIIDISGNDGTNTDGRCFVEYWNGNKEEYYYVWGEGWNLS